MATNDKALASYALLKVNWTEGRTYLDNFVPFVVEACFLIKSQTKFTADEAALATADTFGITLPPHVLHTIFKRIVKAGFGSLKDRCLVLDRKAATQQPRLLVARASFERANADLVEKLKTHALRQYELRLSDEDAQASLYRAIADDSLSILRSAVLGVSTATHEEPTLPADIAAASFISFCLSTDPSATQHIENLAMGSTLASSVYLESVDSQSRKFRDTTLYLDTPVALKALGYEGPRARELALQVIELAKAAGASVAMFEHSVKEAHAVLDMTIDAMNHHGSSSRVLRPIDIYFRDSGQSAIEVTVLQERMEEDLLGLDVHIKAKPDDYTKYGIDEKAFEATLQEKVGYKRRKTLLNDLDSIAAVVRLRGDKRASNLETAHAVLISDNTSLQYATRAHFKSSRSWDLVMMEDTLATMLWLKQPTLSPRLPMVRVAADCFAALTPSKGLLQAFISEVDAQLGRKEITADDALMLRSTIEAERAIVVETGGDPANVNSEAVERVRVRVAKLITAPIDEKLQESQNALLAVSQKQDQLQQELVRLRALDVGLRARASKSASRTVVAIRVGIGVFIFVALTVAALLDVFPTAAALPSPWDGWGKAGVAVSAVVLSVLATVGLLAIPAVSRSIERVRRSIELVGLRRFNLSEADVSTAVD